jgi:D-sedoheptulose 7-phosphate isomerase
MNEQAAALVVHTLKDAAAAHERMTANAAVIVEAAAAIGAALRTGRMVFAFGNGGSAADAQHFTAELVGRFERERRPLAAVALSTDTSALTAIANDYGFDRVFARQLEALGREGDVATASARRQLAECAVRTEARTRASRDDRADRQGRTGGSIAAPVAVSRIAPRGCRKSATVLHVELSRERWKAKRCKKPVPMSLLTLTFNF